MIKYLRDVFAAAAWVLVLGVAEVVPDLSVKVPVCRALVITATPEDDPWIVIAVVAEVPTAD